MKDFLNVILYQPLEGVTLFLYHLFGDNFGIAIIVLTVLIRLILVPLSLPALKSSQKMQELQGELSRLKAKHKDNKAKLQEEQLKLYREHGINPLGGCLPILLQIPILLILWRVLTGLLAQDSINSHFLWLNLSQPDPYYILPALAGISQFIQSKMMMSAKPKKEDQKALEKTSNPGKKEDDLGNSLTQAMQKENLYFMPILWVVMLLRLPSGLGLYMVVSILFGVVQQFFLNAGRKEQLKTQSSKVKA